jgi:hypothetical protein
MKRRLFKSILHVPYGCGWTAICEENKAWHLPNGAAEWIELPELPPIDDTDATIAEIHNRLNKDFFTRDEFVKDYDRRHGTDMGNLPANFFDPSLGQPWPEDQASDRAVAKPRIIYQHVVGQCIAGGNGGFGSQDLPIRDWANLAGKVDRAERLLVNSIDDTNIDTGCVLRSLIEDIRNELGLPKPSEAAQ